ncbi:MAG: hypothetical protein U0Y82_09660 [Thermoleophilia bacterium]
MAPTVLVLWCGFPNGARIVRSLKDAGFNVIGAFPRDRAGGRSAACPRPLRYPSPVSTPEGFMPWLVATCARYDVDVVLPVDEDVVRLVAHNRAALDGITVVGPTAEQYRALSDKRRLAETALLLGLDTPATVEVDATGPTGAYPPLPSMVKPQTSGSEVEAPAMVHTAEERDAMVGRLVDSGYGAIVQERIDGPRWVVHSVRGPGGVFEHVVHAVRLEWPRGCGLATMKQALPAPARLAEAAKALLDHVDYLGPSGISFLEQNGRFYPHDVNLRLGATTAASINCGFDFPRRAVEAVLGINDRPFDGSPDRRAVHMRFDQELRALISSAKRRDARALGGNLMRVLRVGLGRNGMLDPSPLSPWWLWSLVGTKVGTRARELAPPGRTWTPDQPDRRTDPARRITHSSPASVAGH